jgi:hypothetical protein
MKWPFPGNTKITTPWDEPRPISNPGQHVHGAIDVKADVNSPIIAPEYGELYLYWAIRHEDGVSWPYDGSNTFPWKNYFYDMFGGIIVLKGASGKAHLFAHSYINQLHNKRRHDWASLEEIKSKRFPLTAMLAGGIHVQKGEQIGWAGNAGFSTGPHAHYEIHNGFKWTPWGNRPDPEMIGWEDME